MNIFYNTITQTDDKVSYEAIIVYKIRNPDSFFLNQDF